MKVLMLGHIEYLDRFRKNAVVRDGRVTTVWHSLTERYWATVLKKHPETIRLALNELEAEGLIERLAYQRFLDEPIGQSGHGHAFRLCAEIERRYKVTPDLRGIPFGCWHFLLGVARKSPRTCPWSYKRYPCSSPSYNAGKRGISPDAAPRIPGIFRKHACFPALLPKNQRPPMKTSLGILEQGGISSDVFLLAFLLVAEPLINF